MTEQLSSTIALVSNISLDSIITVLVSIISSGALSTIVTRHYSHREFNRKLEADSLKERRASERENSQVVITGYQELVDEQAQAFKEERAAFLTERAGHVGCIQRVAKIEAKLRKLEADHSNCPNRISELEHALEALSEEVARTSPSQAPQAL